MIIFSAAECHAAVSLPAGEGSVVASEAELKYPPIHLQVTEASLTPAQKSTKTELIQSSQVFEDALHMSGMVYKDEALEKRLMTLIPEDYLGEKAKGFKYRIFVLKDPELNAIATPTGSIYINSGLIATLEDFDQLRLVIGHEAHHIIDQDIVHQYQKMKNEVGAIKVLQIIAAPVVAVAISEADSSTATTIANVYTASNIAISISYKVSIAGYGRDNENECDQFALTLFEKNSYDYRSARKVFETFDRESERYSKGFRYHLFQTHEPGKKRADYVTRFMKEKGYVESIEPHAKDEFDTLTKTIRLENAALNIKTSRVQHALDDLDRLNKVYPDNASIQTLYGQAYAALSAHPEILRDELSNKEWRKLKISDIKKQSVLWTGKSEGFYKRALEIDPEFADAYRGLGLLKEKNEAYQEAIEYFQKYLAIKSDAADRRYVQAKIDRLKKIMAKPIKKKE